MANPRCPNCGKYHTEEVVSRTYSKPGSLICFDCKSEYWIPPKNANHKHNQKQQEKPGRRTRKQTNKKPWTAHMDEVLKEAFESGDYMFEREAGA